MGFGNLLYGGDLYQSMQNETNSMKKLLFVTQVANFNYHQLQAETFFLQRVTFTKQSKMLLNWDQMMRKCFFAPWKYEKANL